MRRWSATRNVLTGLLMIVVSLLSLRDSAGQTSTKAPQQSKPELVLEVGHTYRIETLVFDSQGRLLASAGGRKDRTIKLWEMVTGRQLRTLAGHEAAVKSLAFSADGSQLASGGDDDRIRVWDVRSGQQTKIFYVTQEGVARLAFSPDGRYLVSSAHSAPWNPKFGRAIEPDPELERCPNVTGKPGFCTARGITVWDLRAGRPLYNLPPGWDFAFTADSKRLVTSGNQTKLSVWEVQTGRELPALPNAAPPFALSGDGRQIASLAGDQSVKVWDLDSAKELLTLSGNEAPLRFVEGQQWLITSASDRYLDRYKIWDLKTGRELSNLSVETAGPGSKAISNDAHWLAASDYFGGITLFDLITGKEYRTSEKWRGPVAFSADGKWLAAVGSGTTPWLLNLETKLAMCTQAGAVTAISSLALAAAGDKSLSLISGSSGIKVWDLITGEQSRSLARGDYQVAQLALTPDGRRLISAGPPNFGVTEEAIEYLSGVGSSSNARPKANEQDRINDPGKCLASAQPGRSEGYIPEDQIVVWEMASGNLLQYLAGGTAPIALSKDGESLASAASSDYAIKLWNLRTGAPAFELAGQNGAVMSLALDPVHQLLAAAREGQGVELWSLAAALSQPKSSGKSEALERVTVSADGQWLATGSASGVVQLRGLPDGKEVRTLDTNNAGIASLGFSSQGHWLVAGTNNGAVFCWSASNWTRRQLTGHTGTVTSVAFSADEKQVFTASEDGTILIWQTKTGTQLARLISLRGSKEWLVITPDGLFDGSPAAWNQILWRFDNNTFEYAPVEVFFNDYYYPGLLADIISGRHPRAPKDISQKDRRQPELKMSLSGVSDPGSVASRNVTVKLEITSAPAGAQDVRLFRNGSLVKLWPGDVLKTASGRTLEATIPITAGENRLSAYAFNHDNIKSSDTTLLVTGSDQLRHEGKTYILAVGINSYSNTNYNLRYAIADAEGFGNELKRQQSLLKNNAQVEIISLIDSAASKAGIFEKLAQLGARVQPEDTVFLFFAGHGMASDNSFYLIPYDLGYAGKPERLNAAGVEAIRAHSISDRELERALRNLDVRQLVLVIDACNSGQALDAAERRRGPMNSKGLAQLAYEKGMYILTAAQSYQAAKEAELLGHGYLTYALVVEGLAQGAADTQPRDGHTFVREWLDYATNRVPQMQLEKMKQARGIGLHLSFVEGEAKDLPPDQQGVQRPRVFYRRELEAQPLVVAQTGTAKP